MNVLEYPLLHASDLMQVVLKAAGFGSAGLEDCLRLLRGYLEEAREHPPVGREEILERLEDARLHLEAARLIAPAGAGRFAITDRGRRVLAENPQGIDDTVLMAFPEFRAFVKARAAHPAPEDARAVEYDRGFASYMQGCRLSDNPYRPDTCKHLAWESGWTEARDTLGRAP